MIKIVIELNNEVKNFFSDPLFDLLLDLATTHDPESSITNDGKNLTSVACACLLSLVVVRGDTGRLLATVAALLMSSRTLVLQNIQVRSLSIIVTIIIIH